MDVEDVNEVESFSDSEDNYVLDGITEDLCTQEAEANEFESLSPEDLVNHMSEIISDVLQVIDLPKTIIRLLLDRKKWDKGALIESYFEHGQLHLLRNAHIMRSVLGPNGEFPSLKLRTLDQCITEKSLASQKEVTCVICYSSESPCEMLAVGCHHFFCRGCWIVYLTCRIMEENQGDRIYCPAFECECLIDDDSVSSLLTDSQVQKRFRKVVTNSFVMHNCTLTWCPGLDCGFAARSFVGSEPREVTCRNCEESFCFACGNPWHEPVLCHYLRLWLKQVSDDAGTSHWIAANTKECPKCRATIEKNGGCNHMTCRNVHCKHEFCWVCLGSWGPHGSLWYNCNRFDESAAQKARNEQTASRVNLERYLFFFNRFANHAQSRKFESKLYETVQRRMEELQNQGMSWIDVKFVKQVVDVLCQCRRTLMYTYVFAYYLKKNNQSLIFESNQSDLELATEQLSEFFDSDLTTYIQSEVKQKLQDKSRYCENRRRVLLDHVQEGYEKDMWTHTLP